MHKLIDYICGELEDLERKSEKEGLSMAEVQYGDTLAHFKKNLLKSEEMMGEDEYSMTGGGPYEGSYARGGNQGRGQSRRNERSMRGSYRSYARGRGNNARRNNMGRYSREDGYSMASEDMVEELHELMQDAPDEQTRKEFQKFIQRIESM